MTETQKQRLEQQLWKIANELRGKSMDLSDPFPEIPDDIDIVFDLAGSISKSSLSITSAIKQSDVVLIPIYNEIKSITA